MSRGVRTAVVAWLLTAVYYFYQYTVRSAPAVMMPQLSEAFGLTTMGVASMVGLFYWGYGPFSLVAGAAMDRLGPRKAVPIGAAAVGIGALLFATGNRSAASVGCFLQGAGGVFSIVGAIYIVTANFPASKAATLIGATQMFGMAGGSAGQFVVGPLIGAGLSWRAFWIGMGIGGLVISVLLAFLIPAPEPSARRGNWIAAAGRSLGVVFRNPQSILCGVIAGLLFLPTTILDMTWGVRFLQDAYGFGYAGAVVRSAAVPFGWIIGSPLLGYLSDRIGRRKPVIIGAALVLLGCLAEILYGRAGVLPPYLIAIVTGIASGGAMVPYTVVKETNPPGVGGSATGVANFLNFTLSALLGLAFGAMMAAVSGGALSFTRENYQATFEPLLYGVGLAIVLTFFLRETGPAARAARSKTRG